MKWFVSYIKRPYAWAITCSGIITILTGYVLLDAFVIPRTYVIVEESNNQSEADNQIESIEQTETTEQTEAEEQKDIICTSDSYSDGEITIQLANYRRNNTEIYVADIVFTSIDALQTAFANNTYGKNITEKTSAIAKENDAILAINGDFYGARDGYVIRNGVLYRDRIADDDQEDLVIYPDGSFSVIKEGAITAQELIDQGAWQVLSFGPALVMDGEIEVSTRDEVDQAMTSNPRTAIGIIDNLHYVMVVADGRTSQSEGLSLYELAEFMSEELGTKIAYNLDGGGSSTMYFNGEIINQPTTNGHKIKERSVSDIVYIG